MVLKDVINPKDRMIRINNQNPKIFKKAYEELEKAVEYAESHFADTAIYPQLKQALEKYTPRYKQLKNP